MKKVRGFGPFILARRKKLAHDLQKTLSEFESEFSRKVVFPDVLAVVTAAAQLRLILAAHYGRPRKRRA